MRGSMIRHKFNVERIIHHTFYPSGSTMVMHPWFGFKNRECNAANRKILADRIRELRKANAIPKEWVRLPEHFPKIDHFVRSLKPVVLTYRVEVGNIGNVYSGRDKLSALRTYALYLAMSKSNAGNAGGEDVTVFEGDNILKEHIANPEPEQNT